MIYLLPDNLLTLMLKQKGFQLKYGLTYAYYISSSVELTDILYELVYSSESYTDALYIINYFGLTYTHNYLEYHNISNSINENKNEKENICLSVTN